MICPYERQQEIADIFCLLQVKGKVLAVNVNAPETPPPNAAILPGIIQLFQREISKAYLTLMV